LGHASRLVRATLVAFRDPSAEKKEKEIDVPDGERIAGINRLIDRESRRLLIAALCIRTPFLPPSTPPRLSPDARQKLGDESLP